MPSGALGRSRTAAFEGAFFSGVTRYGWTGSLCCGWPTFLILIDLADTAAKGMDHLFDIGVGYALMRAFLVLGAVIAIRTERRAFHGPFAAVSLIWTIAFFWVYRPVIVQP